MLWAGNSFDFFFPFAHIFIFTIFFYLYFSFFHHNRSFFFTFLSFAFFSGILRRISLTQPDKVQCEIDSVRSK